MGKVFTKKSSNQIIKMFDIKKYFDESSKTISNLYLFEKELISFCNLIHKTNNNGNKILVAEMEVLVQMQNILQENFSAHIKAQIALHCPPFQSQELQQL